MRLVSEQNQRLKHSSSGFHTSTPATKPSTASGSDPLVFIVPGQSPEGCQNRHSVPECDCCVSGHMQGTGLARILTSLGSKCPPGQGRGGYWAGTLVGVPGHLTRWIRAGAACTSLPTAGWAAQGWVALLLSEQSI